MGKLGIENAYSIHPIKRTVRLAFWAIFETQNTVRLIGILEIFINSTFNRDAGQCRTNFLKYSTYKYKWLKDHMTDLNIKEISDTNQF